MAATPPDPLLDRPSWAPGWVPSIDDVRQIRIFRWVLSAVFAAGLTACVTEGADRPTDPELGGSSTTGETDATGTTGPEAVTGLAARFGTVMVEILAASGRMVELCLLDADTAPERSRGLMEVTDLEGHDGMLFTNETSVESAYVMIDTVMPLSITWWQETGEFRSGLDMVPCTEADPAACPRYPASGPYRWAIEVPQGALADAAIGDGSRLQIGAPGCTPA